LLSGYLGDLVLTGPIKSLLPKGYNNTVLYLPFLGYKNIFSGRIWFWGFVVFFFVLGVVGSIFYCCFRNDAGSQNEYGRDQYNHSTCWWIFCGPSYYNGYYYYSPYGYWGPGDILCFYWLLTPHYHYHQSAICCYGDCTHCCHGGIAGCSGGGGDCGKDGLGAFAIIIIIVVVVFVVIGVVVGSLLAFLIVNKILKRHLTLLERQASTQKYVVCNLDNQTEVVEAEQQEKNGELAQFTEVFVQPHGDDANLVNEPLNKPPKGKGFDLY